MFHSPDENQGAALGEFLPHGGSSFPSALEPAVLYRFLPVSAAELAGIEIGVKPAFLKLLVRTLLDHGTAGR
jgi:hypothetical protein